MLHDLWLPGGGTITPAYPLYFAPSAGGPSQGGITGQKLERKGVRRGKEVMGPKGGWDARHRTGGVGLYWLPFNFFQSQAQYVSLTQIFKKNFI